MNGKGSKRRPTDERAYRDRYDRTFGKRVKDPGKRVYKLIDGQIKESVDEQFSGLRFMDALLEVDREREKGKSRRDR